MIDEKKLIDRLRNMEYSRCPSLECWEHSSKDCGYCEEREIKAGDAIKIVKELSSEYNNEWIPCSEKLPEESLNSVIGWDEYRERCCFVQYYSGKWHIGSDIESVKIVAWLPLPEPFRPNGE